jgi:hypothetical protein
MRRARRRHIVWLLVAAFVALAALAPSAAVAQPAAATELSISGQADWIGHFQINVYVTVRGEGGTGFVNVNVQQAQPPLPPNSGFGGTQIICDGQRRTYGVFVGPNAFPGWQLGEAEASASASCPSSGTDFETKSIRITKP